MPLDLGFSTAPRRPRAVALAAPLAVAVALVAGCTQPRPEPEVLPELGLPAGWTAGELPDPSPDAGVDAWWRGFGEPELAEAVERALEANRDLAVAAARLDQALARARIAGAALAPRLDATATAVRQRQSFLGFPIPGGEERVLSTTTTRLGVSLDVSWEADLWGRLAAGRDAAAADADAAALDLAAAALSIAGQSAKAWLAAREATEQVALADKTLENRERTTERVRRRYEAGLRSALDLRLARADEAAARAVVAARRQAADALARQLAILLAEYPERPADPIAAAGEELPPAALAELRLPPVPAALPAELVARRPDLAAFERRLAAAGHRVAEARAALYPRLSLTGSAGTASQEIQDLLDRDFAVWSIAGNLLQPIFDAGRLRAGVDLAAAGFDEATARYAGELLRAFAEVETALAAGALLEAEAAALADAAREATAAARLADERYRAGLVDLLTLLDAERRAYDAESRRAEAVRRRLTNRVDLVLALGGGWSAAPSSDTAASGPVAPSETP